MFYFQGLISERYRLQQHLHHGMMSDVYLAYDEHLHCNVVFKLVSNDQTESRLRLQSEIQTLLTLTHDHILPVLDHGEYEAYHYLVMPYMKQGTLLKRMSKGRLSEVEVGNILVQVTSALQFAHDQGIVHRDIKPSNILLDGDSEHSVYLADFGLAKAFGKVSDLTQTGCLIGTPEYMAPELIDKPESISSDIYALGILLYHMLAGRPPFRANSPLAVCWKQLREMPVPPSQFNPAISPPVEQVILCALHKDPQQRFPGAKALAQAYMKALLSSKHSEVSNIVPIFELTQAQITPRHVGRKRLPATSPQVAPTPGWKNYRHTIHKAIVSLALVAMFIFPLSLGFLLGRERDQIPQAYSAQFASTLHQPLLASTPTPQPTQTTPTAHPSSVKTLPPRFMPSVYHKHQNHHHKNGNDNASINEA